MTQQQPRICILGGGFGGLYTALRLSQLPFSKTEKPEIVLVDRRDRFLFVPLLYELLTANSKPGKLPLRLPNSCKTQVCAFVKVLSPASIWSKSECSYTTGQKFRAIALF